MEYIEKTIDGIISPMAEKNVHHAAVYIYDPKNKKVLAYIGNRRKEVGGSMVDMIQERRSV
jgi:membrane carboxypeptidase/penicillin-binding protein PbpC